MVKKINSQKDYLEQFIEIFEKDTGKKITHEEAEKYYANLSQLVDIVLEVAKQEHYREKRLEKFPNGFSLAENEGTYTCLICYKSISGEETWWDKNGIRCSDCQRNIQQGIIPVEICKNESIWFKDWQIKSDFKIHPATAKKLKREGLLRARELKDISGKLYFNVYMVQDNTEFLKKYKGRMSNRTNPLFIDEDNRMIF